jgi:hypothetical protein
VERYRRTPSTSSGGQEVRALHCTVAKQVRHTYVYCTFAILHGALWQAATPPLLCASFLSHCTADLTRAVKEGIRFRVMSATNDDQTEPNVTALLVRLPPPAPLGWRPPCAPCSFCNSHWAKFLLPETARATPLRFPVSERGTEPTPANRPNHIARRRGIFLIRHNLGAHLCGPTRLGPRPPARARLLAVLFCPAGPSRSPTLSGWLWHSWRARRSRRRHRGSRATCPSSPRCCQACCHARTSCSSSETRASRLPASTARSRVRLVFLCAGPYRAAQFCNAAPGRRPVMGVAYCDAVRRPRGVQG